MKNMMITVFAVFSFALMSMAHANAPANVKQKVQSYCSGSGEDACTYAKARWDNRVH